MCSDTQCLVLLLIIVVLCNISLWITFDAKALLDLEFSHLRNFISTSFSKTKAQTLQLQYTRMVFLFLGGGREGGSFSLPPCMGFS